MSALAILCYHRVLPDEARQGPGRPYFVRGTAVSEETFRSHVAALTLNFDVVSESDVLAWAAGGALRSKRACWITFDDGYREVLTLAAPILAAARAPATVFVATDTLTRDAVLPADRWYGVLNAATREHGLLNGTHGPWAFDLALASDFARLIDGPEKRAFLESAEPDRESFLADLARAVGAPNAKGARRLYLDVSELRELVDLGWSVGSHTRSHAILPKLPLADVDRELVGSRDDLAAAGFVAASLAYPDGAWSPELATRTRERGYALGLTLEAARADASHLAGGLPRLLPADDARWVEGVLLR